MKTYSIFFGAGSAGNVRGKQVGELLGAKLNPISGYENDICIYVKVIPPDNHPKHSYLDVDDSTRAVEYLKTHKNIGVIANSLYSKDKLQTILGRDDIVYIPHIHCNYEGLLRPDRPVKTVGIIGSKTSFMYPIEDIKKRLKVIGLDLIYNPDYWKTYGDEPEMTEQQRRKKIVDFYMSIDIQIAWRKGAFTPTSEILKNPNKLVNAGAFGIPTVAYPEESYLYDWTDDFIPAYKIQEMLLWCDSLKEDRNFYSKWSDNVLKRSRFYHYKHIKSLYELL